MNRNETAHSGLDKSGSYEAEIRWTTHGVPHIRANDWGSLGFGQGYACAQHHFATIADQICKVRSHRSRFLGRGIEDSHLNSDIGYKVLGLHSRAYQSLQSQPQRVVQLLSGFACGLNTWLNDGKDMQGNRSRLPAWCQDAPWIELIGPIEPADILAYAADLALAASGRNLIEYIALARPPGPEGPAPTPSLAMLGSQLASNGWGVGKELSKSGHGIIVANPHFPWYGEARFWECHLTIPGSLDVYGAALVGTPGIQIGFNKDVAWTHTFSIGKRFTIYRLSLDPQCPSRYSVDGELKNMSEETITVEVMGPGSEVEEISRTLWKSDIGPMLNLPLLGWSNNFGFTYRDANVDFEHFISQWLGMASATSLDAFREVFSSENGIPWVTTVATDKTGRVWFTDASHTPNLSQGALSKFSKQLAQDPITKLLDQNRVALLDGSYSEFYWSADTGGQEHGLIRSEDGGNLSGGLISPDKLPSLERNDWISNCNDSHWLSNPYEPLEGFSLLVGPEGVAPAPRTRANFAALGRPSSDKDAKLDAVQLERRLFSNASILAEILCDEIVERLEKAVTVTVGKRSVDLVRAARVLKGWDRKFNLDSRGCILWRETMAGFSDEDLKLPGRLFHVPFSLAEPLSTPNTLAKAPEGKLDPVIDAVAQAVLALEEAEISIDAPLGEVQWAARGAERVAIHGGQEFDGVANILAPTGLLISSSLEPVSTKSTPIPQRTERSGLRKGGYEITYGTSFIMVVEMQDVGPKARGLLVYGQSEDPASPHYSDQIHYFSAKKLRPLLFTESDIIADPEYRVEIVTNTD